MFDLLHPGHTRIIERAKRLGAKLIVGVLTDSAAEAYKPTPVQSFKQRKEIVESLRAVDHIVTLRSSDATYLLKKLKPDILVHGDDHHPDWEIGQTWMKNTGRQFVLLPYTKGISSSIIKARIVERAI